MGETPEDTDVDRNGATALDRAQGLLGLAMAASGVDDPPSEAAKPGTLLVVGALVTGRALYTRTDLRKHIRRHIGAFSACLVPGRDPHGEQDVSGSIRRRVDDGEREDD